jgi:hypothetical protein
VASALFSAGETPIALGEVYDAGSGPRVVTRGHLAL